MLQLGSKMTFGKHKNKKVKTVLNQDPDYLIWAAENITWFNPTTAIIAEAKKSVVRDGIMKRQLYSQPEVCPQPLTVEDDYERW